MKLYMLRHGPALSRSEWKQSDELRPLSDHGVEVVRAVTNKMAALDLGIELIVTSPFERALRTAAMLRESLGGDVELQEDKGLEPGRFDLEALAEILSRTPEAGAVVVVGHEPSMSTVLSSVVGGGALTFKKAGLARADLWSAAPPAGELRWLVPPSLLE